MVQKVDRAEHGLNYRGALEEDLREYNCSMHFRHDTMLRTGPLSQIVDTHCAYHNLGRRSRLGCSGAAVMVANHHQAALVEHHSHICKSSRCDTRCTPTTDAAGKIRIAHTCTDPFKSTNRPAGLANHICRQCHQNGIVCRTKVCSYRLCATPKNVCHHLHT